MFFVNIVYYVVHIVCEVDVIANSLVLYLPFCSTLNKNFFSLLSLLLEHVPLVCLCFCLRSNLAGCYSGGSSSDTCRALIFEYYTCYFLELSFSKSGGVQDRLPIYPLCGIFYFPWHIY